MGGDENSDFSSHLRLRSPFHSARMALGLMSWVYLLTAQRLPPSAELWATQCARPKNAQRFPTRKRRTLYRA